VKISLKPSSTDVEGVTVTSGDKIEWLPFGGYFVGALTLGLKALEFWRSRADFKVKPGFALYPVSEDGKQYFTITVSLTGRHPVEVTSCGIEWTEKPYTSPMLRDFLGQPALRKLETGNSYLITAEPLENLQRALVGVPHGLPKFVYASSPQSKRRARIDKKSIAILTSLPPEDKELVDFASKVHN
jgi:hypothetical protein